MKILETRCVEADLFRIHHEDGDVSVVEAGVDVVGTLHRSEKERGCNQRNQRESDLSGDESFLESCAAAAESRDVSFFLQAIDQACP